MLSAGPCVSLSLASAQLRPTELSEQWPALRSAGGGVPARKSANSTAGLESPDLSKKNFVVFTKPVQLLGFLSALGSPVQQTNPLFADLDLIG